jgi:hypothetical protein
MTTLYRLLTEDDSSAFCHKVSRALADGWELHGDPVMSPSMPPGASPAAARPSSRRSRAPYSPDLKLGDQ